MRSTNLLGKIEEQAIDGDISKALRLCLSLGGKTGSTALRGWASLELNGYRGQDVPEYRRIVAPLQVDGMTMSHQVKGQTISTYDLPDFVGDTISENVEFRQSLPGLVDLVTQAKKKDEPVRLMAPGATDVVAYMNRKKEQFNIENLYWSIAPSAIQEVIDRVRSNLVELVAEMRAGMSSGDAIPSSKLASQAVNVVINGDKNRVKVKDSVIQTAEAVSSEKGRLRRWLEVAAWLAGIGGSALLLALNWGTLFG